MAGAGVREGEGTQMTQFHEGQEVEVAEIRGDPRPFRVWRKAKIATVYHAQLYNGTRTVQFPDGTHAVFDAKHIRTITSEAEHKTMLAGDYAEEYPGLAEPDDDTSEPMGRENLDDPHMFEDKP